MSTPTETMENLLLLLQFFIPVGWKKNTFSFFWCMIPVLLKTIVFSTNRHINFTKTNGCTLRMIVDFLNRIFRLQIFCGDFSRPIHPVKLRGFPPLTGWVGSQVLMLHPLYQQSDMRVVRMPRGQFWPKKLRRDTNSQETQWQIKV